MHTTAATLLTLADQATATAGTATAYVEGPLRKVGAQAFVFPLGQGGQWARLGISAPASPTTAFTAEYVAAACLPHPPGRRAAERSEPGRALDPRRGRHPRRGAGALVLGRRFPQRPR